MKPPRKNGETCARPGGHSPAAFLLAQLGAHAASKFAERLAQLDLAPPQAGILRILGSSPAITQQALATAIGMVPSRLVALIDELEARGLVHRRENPDDRRRYALHLSEKGHSMLEAIGRISREHQQDLLAVLSEEERERLTALLQKIADQQGLARGIHPGYARLGRSI